MLTYVNHTADIRHSQQLWNFADSEECNRSTGLLGMSLGPPHHFWMPRDIPRVCFAELDENFQEELRQERRQHSPAAHCADRKVRQTTRRQDFGITNHYLRT